MRKDSLIVDQLISDLRYLRLFTGSSSKQNLQPLEEAMQILEKHLEKNPQVLKAALQ